MQNTIKPKNRWVSKVVVFIILVGGTLVLSYFAYTQTIKQIQFVKNSTPSTGTVIALSESRNSDGGIMYSPVIEYVAQDGRVQSFTSSLSTNSPGYSKGETVNIRIPENGGYAQIDSFMSLWFGLIILSFFAAVFLMILILSIVGMIQSSRIKESLEKDGVVIQAKVIVVDESLGSKDTVMGWYITAQWHSSQDNIVYTFDSPILPYNPKEFVKDVIDVKILPNNPKVYEMDLSKLPASAEDYV